MPLIPKQEPPYYEPESTSPIKEYLALLNQSGTNPPTAIVIINTLGINVSFGYSGPGDYTCIATGMLTLNKTVVRPTINIQDFQVICPPSSFNINQFGIYTYYNIDGTFYNDSLINTPIQILVYP